jgi:hypothetical protein
MGIHDDEVRARYVPAPTGFAPPQPCRGSSALAQRLRATRNSCASRSATARDWRRHVARIHASW